MNMIQKSQRGPSRSQIGATWFKVGRWNWLSLGLTREGRGGRYSGGKEHLVTLRCFPARSSTQPVLPRAFPTEAEHKSTDF